MGCLLGETNFKEKRKGGPWRLEKRSGNIGVGDPLSERKGLNS